VSDLKRGGKKTSAVGKSAQGFFKKNLKQKLGLDWVFGGGGGLGCGAKDILLYLWGGNWGESMGS